MQFGAPSDILRTASAELGLRSCEQPAAQDRTCLPSACRRASGIILNLSRRLKADPFFSWLNLGECDTRLDFFSWFSTPLGLAFFFLQMDWMIWREFLLWFLVHPTSARFGVHLGCGGNLWGFGERFNQWESDTMSRRKQTNPFKVDCRYHRFFSFYRVNSGVLVIWVTFITLVHSERTIIPAWRVSFALVYAPWLHWAQSDSLVQPFTISWHVNMAQFMFGLAYQLLDVLCTSQWSVKDVIKS